MHSLRLMAMAASAMDMDGMDMIQTIICDGVVLGGFGGVLV
jgi:hypothetical protein